MQSKDNTIRRRITASYFTSIVSITLVLFLLGLAGILILNAQKLSAYVKENIGISVFLKDAIREVDIFSLQKILDTKKYVKETRYITREEAAEEMKNELGEDFVKFLGYNPLPSSIDVKLNAAYANPDSFKVLEKEFRAYPQVADVAYQKDLIYAVSLNIKKISLVIIILTALLLVIASTLINNTIRLSVYSKRFIIRTMQLVGAHNYLIRRPFIIKGITQGIVSSLLAILFLLTVLYIAEQQMEGLFSFRDFQILGIIFATIIFFGFIIAWLSTLMSVNKYLKIKTDNLYT
jgi:cell division transport system permease protein